MQAPKEIHNGPVTSYEHHLPNLDPDGPGRGILSWLLIRAVAIFFFWLAVFLILETYFPGLTEFLRTFTF